LETETTTQQQGNSSWTDAAAASAEAEHEAKHPPRQFTELLPVKLTERELADRARKAAAARRRVAEYEAQKAVAAAHWKAKIELAENERDELLDIIDSGVEEREVECVEEFVWRTGTVIVTRTDLNERVRERAMTQLERNPKLPGIDDGSQLSLDDAADEDADLRELDEDDLEPEEDGTAIDAPQALLDEAQADEPEKPARVIRRKKAKK
jgi:hypothetical protein